MNNQALETKEATEISDQQGNPILLMIQQAARDPETDVEKLERMFALYERQQNRESESEFNRAMNRSQRELTRVSADAVNPQTRSQYATYAALDRALRPVYTNHGFSLSFDTGDTDRPETVRVICHVSHEAGHTRTYHADMPSDGKGAKGNTMMTATHATGAAMSYGMRYLLKLIFNVAIGEDDVDGNVSAPKITEKQAADIEAMIQEVGADPVKFLKYLQVGDLHELPADRFQMAISALEKKRKAA